MSEPAHIEDSRYVTSWALEPMRVFGGWRVMWRRWVRTEDGWDDQSFPSVTLRALYPTSAEALDAIEALEARRPHVDFDPAGLGV